jgi:hypothetical protein
MGFRTGGLALKPNPEYVPSEAEKGKSATLGGRES